MVPYVKWLETSEMTTNSFSDPLISQTYAQVNVCPFTPLLAVVRCRVVSMASHCCENLAGLYRVTHTLTSPCCMMFACTVTDAWLIHGSDLWCVRFTQSPCTSCFHTTHHMLTIWTSAQCSVCVRLCCMQAQSKGRGDFSTSSFNPTTEGKTPNVNKHQEESHSYLHSEISFLDCYCRWADWRSHEATDLGVWTIRIKVIPGNRMSVVLGFIQVPFPAYMPSFTFTKKCIYLICFLLLSWNLYVWMSFCFVFCSHFSRL